jgi:hypothetical protein
VHIKTNTPKPQTYFPAKHLLETGVKRCLVATRLFFAKLLLLRSEAELETCEAPFAAERSGAGDLRSSFLGGFGRALGGFGYERLIC